MNATANTGPATATLSIDAFYTTLAIGEGPGREHVNLLFPWVDGDVTPSTRQAADEALAERGLIRCGDWAATADPTVHTATIR